MEQTRLDWLLLAYSLPTEPSRFRVSIWRRLRKLGAVYLNEGFWVLPNLAEMVTELESVIKEIQGFNGTASAFASKDLEVQQRTRLRDRFLDARNEEYSELQGQHERFLLHIDHARSTRRFTFAEVEELEEELAKLERWLAEIHARDVFGSAEYASTARSLEEGRGLLQRFTEDTFTELGENRPNIDPAGGGPA